MSTKLAASGAVAAAGSAAAAGGTPCAMPADAAPACQGGDTGRSGAGHAGDSGGDDDACRACSMAAKLLARSGTSPASPRTTPPPEGIDITTASPPGAEPGITRDWGELAMPIPAASPVGSTAAAAVAAADALPPASGCPARSSAPATPTASPCWRRRRCNSKSSVLSGTAGSAPLPAAGASLAPVATAGTTPPVPATAGVPT